MSCSDEAGLRQQAETCPAAQPRAILVWSAAVAIGSRESLGASPVGERWIVPITGGAFWGAPGFEAFSGRVRPGGADRQLLRPDGVRELCAEYEMNTLDGTVVSLRNEVIVDDHVQPDRYAMSRIRVTAPEGIHDWMNRRLFVGTLHTLRPHRAAVVVRGFMLETA
jgi:hypothetical protein